MRVEARIAGKKERKMGWSTKATIVLYGVVIALLVGSYGWSCTGNQPENPAAVVETLPTEHRQ